MPQVGLPKLPRFIRASVARWQEWGEKQTSGAAGPGCWLVQGLRHGLVQYNDGGATKVDYGLAATCAVVYAPGRRGKRSAFGRDAGGGWQSFADSSRTSFGSARFRLGSPFSLDSVHASGTLWRKQQRGEALQPQSFLPGARDATVGTGPRFRLAGVLEREEREHGTTLQRPKNNKGGGGLSPKDAGHVPASSQRACTCI